MKITAGNVLFTLSLILLAIGVWVWGFLSRPYPAFGGEAIAAMAITFYAIYSFINEAIEAYEEERAKHMHW